MISNSWCFVRLQFSNNILQVFKLCYNFLKQISSLSNLLYLTVSPIYPSVTSQSFNLSPIEASHEQNLPHFAIPSPHRPTAWSFSIDSHFPGVLYFSFVGHSDHVPEPSELFCFWLTQYRFHVILFQFSHDPVSSAPQPCIGISFH